MRGNFSAKVGLGTVTNGFGSKGATQISHNFAGGLILEPFRKHVPPDRQKLKAKNRP